MDTENIVVNLVGQHRQLQRDLGDVVTLLGSSEPNAHSLDISIKQFATNLTQHLHLENDIFYVNLLKKMKEKAQDTTKTEQFISQMGEIAKTVMIFLDMYGDEKKIAVSLEGLKHDLPAIVETLNLRIESEEAGVYSYWGLF